MTINRLKSELVFRKEYIEELAERIRSLENENSSLYQKLINEAKNTVDQSLSSPKKANNQMTRIKQ